MHFEQIVAHWYHRHLSIALPLTLLVIKLFVRFVSREKPKDLYKSLLVLPLDFVYISTGLMLAALARSLPAFAGKFASPSDADLQGAILLLALILLAIFLTLCDRLVRWLWQKFYAAWTLYKSDAQLPLEFPPAGPNEASNSVSTQKAQILVWVLVYMVFLLPVFLVEIVCAFYALAYTLGRVSS